MSKRPRSGEGDVDVDRSGCRWKDLSPDILASVFVRLPVEEMMQAVPMVCMSWYKVVLGPYCWREIDIDSWCKWTRKPQMIDSVVTRLVRRSRCTIVRLSGCRFGDPSFAIAASCGRLLKVLEMPMSKVTDEIVKRHGGTLTNLTVLNISHCPLITVIGLEVLGRTCKALTQLKRNMPPPLWNEDVKTDDREALVIADTMTGLVKLELAYSRMGRLGLRAILNKCEGLTHLDIQGCQNIQQLDDDTQEKCQRLVDFKYPWFYDSDFLYSSTADDGAEASSSDSSSQ